MIRAMVFDLDGTLVQTERLKARSYASAAIELCPYTISEDEVLEAFKEVVGRSRREVATALVERFDLAERARARMDEFGVSTPWQAYVQVRLNYYEEMMAQPEVLRQNQWPHTMKLLRTAREWNCKTALATMSGCDRAQHVLEALELTGAFDFVATRDDVERGKPDPDIYLLVSQELEIQPAQCLVMEDSPSGVAAARAAEMWCIAIATPFTRERLHEQALLAPHWIVDDPDLLPEVVERMLEETDEQAG